MHDSAIEEEGEVAYHLHEAGVVHKLVWRSFVAQGPGELAWQVAGLEEAEGEEEEENFVYIYMHYKT
jgi:flavin reductase (DIM6/NTAB) family NADH-FMN oxidoreductase RutF